MVSSSGPAYYWPYKQSKRLGNKYVTRVWADAGRGKSRERTELPAKRALTRSRRLPVHAFMNIIATLCNPMWILTVVHYLSYLKRESIELGGKKVLF